MKNNISQVSIKTVRFTILLFLFLLGGTINLSAQTVYITKTGAKYHKSNCRHLSKSKISISLEDAKGKYYTACKVCKPSTTVTNKAASTNTSVTQKSTYSTSSKKAIATRCTATTKAGTRCKRKTKNSSGKCWQHE
jgi:hypothetical protein